MPMGSKKFGDNNVYGLNQGMGGSQGVGGGPYHRNSLWSDVFPSQVASLG